MPKPKNPPSEEEERAAERFKALGDTTRLQILRFLRDRDTDAKENGDKEAPAVTVGDICLHVSGDKKFTSTIFHHLKELRHAGFVQMERDGKKKLCRLNRKAFGEAAAFLSLLAAALPWDKTDG